MPEKRFLTPLEIAESAINTGVKKCVLYKRKVFLLAILAGAFIALGAASSNMVIHSLSDNFTGLKKLLAGAIFPVGLMMIVMAGGELFTGNNLLVVAALQKKITWKDVLGNWFVVYTGNFIGACLIAWLLYQSGLFATSQGGLGVLHVNSALVKVNLTFSQAFIRGVLCNMLVVIAVWMAYGATSIGDKVLAIWFPVMLFVSGGYEHSIANMYYIPAGIFALDNPVLVQQLNWYSFLLKNLVPVTLGNIVGGSVLVGIVYWYVYCYNHENVTGTEPFLHRLP